MNLIKNSKAISQIKINLKWKIKKYDILQNVYK